MGGSRARDEDVREDANRGRECPVCDEPVAIASDGVPYHLTCSLDGDHDVCDPDDRHIPHG